MIGSPGRVTGSPPAIDLETNLRHYPFANCWVSNNYINYIWAVYHKLYVTRCYKYLVRTRERVQESWWMVANARFAHIVVGGGWTATSPPPQKMAIPSQTLGVSVQKWWMSPLKHAGISQLSEDWKNRECTYFLLVIFYRKNSYLHSIIIGNYNIMDKSR